MRHGRKSKAQRFDGFKVSVATDADSELILDIQDMPGVRRRWRRVAAHHRSGSNTTRA